MRNRRINSKQDNITGANQTVAIECLEATGVLLQIFASAISATFVVEASMDSTDGANGSWVLVGINATDAANLYTQIASTNVLSVPPTRGWIARVVPFRWVRVRCSVWTSGTNVRALLTAFAGEI